MSLDRSVGRAHRYGMNLYGAQLYPDGLVPYAPAQAPIWPADSLAQATGRLRHCQYCGSMHPEDTAAALLAGARAEWADLKYGYPHKLYLDAIPNPHAGLLECRASMWPGTDEPPEKHPGWLRVKTGFFDQNTGQPTYCYADPGTPAPPTTSGKFYTLHLLDATPEERQIIEFAMGISFTFHDDGGLSWRPVEAVAA